MPTELVLVAYTLISIAVGTMIFARHRRKNFSPRKEFCVWFGAGALWPVTLLVLAFFVVFVMLCAVVTAMSIVGATLGSIALMICATIFDAED